MVITGGGVIHDMRCDGSLEHGVHDVAARNYKTNLNVIAAYENGVHVLGPVGLRVRLISRLRGYSPVVTRYREGDELVWSYVGFTARLKRVGGPEAGPPAPK